MEAWVTSALENRDVDQAIVLALSLRRVLTGKKLVVLTSSGLKEELRRKLKSVFDLVHLIDQTSRNGFCLEAYAKLEGFSLLAFSKCVYISPHSLVLKNCDEIFQKYATFAALAGPDKTIDSSVYLYVPSMQHYEKFRMVGGFGTRFKDVIPKVENLEKQYNVKLNLKSPHVPEKDAAIVTFVDGHPIQYPDRMLSDESGLISKLANELCLKIFLAEVKCKSGTEIASQVAKGNYKTEPVAIIGMSFRLPGGNNPDEFWDALKEGRQCVVPIPPSRRMTMKEISNFPSEDWKFEAGFLNVPLDEFDEKFFGISPKEAESLDPQQRLLHEVAWEAMEDAMVDPLTLRGTQTGVFVGSWLHEYKDICMGNAEMDFFRVYIGNTLSTTTARLSHFLETTGPTIANETACASSMVAIDMACKSLRNGTSDLALAGGVNLLLSLKLNELGPFLAPDFRCKAFDANANGFARAEACAVLVLKRLSDAVRDDDKIWGIIRGSALAQEGVSKSIGTPTVHSESLAMELALKDAGVEANEVSYVEMHGTGTAVGDPVEVAAVAKAYSKGRQEPLVIGSVKTNVGHTESVSGFTGMIKVLLSMKNEMIPKQLNLETLNPQINFGAVPAKVPLEPVLWPKSKNKRRIAGVSSFGFSGTVGHAIIEEAPVISKIPCKIERKRPLHIMKISAKSKESMELLLHKYLKLFSQKVESGEVGEQGFADMAHSANTGRSSFNIRTVLVAKNFDQALRLIKEGSYMQADVHSRTAQLCFLFTGQGSQYPNMAKQLYETSPIFKDSFDKCDEVLQMNYQISIRKILWPESGPGEELSRTLYSQTSIFVVEYCLLKLFESWGVKPDYVMGHSLGEFAAAVAAGALTFEDALMLVAERSRLIDDLPRGKMLVIKSHKKTVDNVIFEFRRSHPSFWVDYAALNSHDQTVVAGETEMIEEFAKFCGEKSLKCIILASTHAFHSRHMNPILEPYRKVAATVKRPELEERQERPLYISGMEGGLVDIDAIDADYWVRHTREKVRFIDACKTVQQQEGVTLFLEVGPHPVLSALVMANLEGQPITCFPSIKRKEEEWVTLLGSLGKLYISDWKGEVDWKGFDKFYKRDKVKLPFYPFNRKSIWTKTERIYPTVHRLLGKLIPTASSTETIYQTLITMKSADFAQDHVIGNTIIFPGAAFLEMCLAGGHSTLERFTDEVMKPRRPIYLKSLKILSPLALSESGSCKLQTVVSLGNRNEENELGYSVAVHRQVEDKDEGDVKWMEHASATFLPIAPKLPQGANKQVDLTSIQSVGVKSDNREFYEKLREVGVRFGPKFQSLETAWKSEEGLLASVKVPEDHHKYLIHPVVADAMIQAVLLWESKDKLKIGLQVPVQIGEFIWIRESNSSTRFVYCSTDDDTGKVYCTLVDEGGNPLAYMAAVDLIETKAVLVEGMIQQQSDAMPNLWQEIWQSYPVPCQGAIDFHDAGIVQAFGTFRDEDRAVFDEQTDVGEEERRFLANVQNIARLYFLKALYDLGWKPEVGARFSLEDLLTSLKIKPNFLQQVRFFLRSFANKWGILRILKSDDESESTFQICKPMPSQEQVETELRFTITGKQNSRMEFKLIKEVGENLRGIFEGEVDPLSILFTEDPSKPSASKFYQSLMDSLKGHMKVAITSKIEHHLIKAKDRYVTSTKSQQRGRPVIRILEVGAGTGALTEILLDILDTRAIDFDVEFYMTDVTSAFFSSAEKTFEKYLKYITFKKFDMESDPLEQGFCPGYFDGIFAFEVLHIAKDIRRALKNLRSLLKSGGMLQFEETVLQDERITFIFGVLDGYWQFRDYDLRNFHTTLTVEMWERTLRDSGFEQVVTVPMYENHHACVTGMASLTHSEPLRNLFSVTNSWIIFGNEDDEVRKELVAKLEGVNRKCLSVSKNQIQKFTEEKVTELLQAKLIEAQEGDLKIEGIVYLWALEPKTRDQREISLPFMSLMKLILELKQPPKVYAIARGAIAMDNSDVTDPTAGTLIGFCRSLANENVSLKLSFLDLDPNTELLGQVDEVFLNFWVESRPVLSFRDGLRMVPKLSTAKILTNEPLSLPSGCDRFQLVLPKTRVISDLEFTYLEPYSIEGKEVEVQVRAVALNFRDLFAVLKPMAAFEKLNAVGLDYAGVVKRVGENVRCLKVGDRVIGMNLSDSLSLPSHVKAEERLLVPLSDGMTFAEGVTIPAVFSTVIHCLINVAQMKKGDSVLVHTASGGVGLAAIQLCNLVGAKVIATAGSTRKRTYLKNLGIEHVFHSRTTDFKEEILEVTNGRGVDIVLNSITGPGFKEASLDALAKNGKFIEMSKLNVWTPEEVKALRPDVFYEVVDLTSLSKDQHEKLTMELDQYLQKGLIKPTPYERFDALNIRGALNYLQKANHIGKIVCIMPEIKMEKSKLVTYTPLFNEDSTYLVTGGLGGIGWEVVNWMLKNGAKHIAIASRSPPNPQVAAKIETWNKTGKHVRAFAVDVGNFDKCKELLKTLNSPDLGFPPLRGVMHAAGVLHDAKLENQNWDKFLQTYNPKVNGSWNLHLLTKDLLLEHFVLFSSIAAILGSPGQTNHSASSSYEDCLVSYRKGNGLPATTINWSTWGEVEVATERSFPGLRPISTKQGLFALGTFLKTQSSHMAVLDVTSHDLVLKQFPKSNDSFLHPRSFNGNSAAVTNSNNDFWNEIVATTNREARIRIFKTLIKSVVKGVLQMSKTEVIEDSMDFKYLGLDSLMMLEVKNGLQNVLRNLMTVTANQIKQCINTDDMANTLVQILEGGDNMNMNMTVQPTELNLLVHEDSNLFQQSYGEFQNMDKIPIERIATVLLTGATGTVGPYLLEELTKRENIKKVYCLVRGSYKMSGNERLKHRLKQLGLVESVNLKKVEVLTGDVTSPKFFLSEATFKGLVEKVDAVVNSAGYIDQTEQYWKGTDNKRRNMSREVNVLGTLHLLQFCAAGGRLKHYCHISSMTACAGIGESGETSNGWQSEEAFADLEFNCAYFLSKHISERLVRRAVVLCGMPCKVFRLPFVAGDSKNGVTDYEKNLFTLRWLTWMKMGTIHDLPIPLPIIPVDYIARICLDIFVNPDAPMDVFNVVPEVVEPEQILIEVAKHFGIKMERVSYERFLAKFKTMDEYYGDLAQLNQEFYPAYVSTFQNPKMRGHWRLVDESKHLFDIKDVLKYTRCKDGLLEPTTQIIIRDFEYLKRQGAFKKFGIELP